MENEQIVSEDRAVVNISNEYFSTITECVSNSSLSVDMPGFLPPCVITGDRLRSDMLLSIDKATLYVAELGVGFEANLNINVERKYGKYLQLTHDLSLEYSQ